MSVMNYLSSLLKQVNENPKLDSEEKSEQKNQPMDFIKENPISKVEPVPKPETQEEREQRLKEERKRREEEKINEEKKKKEEAIAERLLESKFINDVMLDEDIPENELKVPTYI